MGMADRVVKVTLSAQVAQYITAMQEAAAATKKTAEESRKATEKRQAWDALGKSLVVVGGAMTAVGAAVGKTGIEYNTLQQKTRAALTTMLGSAKAANEQMDKLDAFARTSPFSKATFISAQQQMLAFGIETRKVIPYLDALQNAVAASGGSNTDIAGLVATMSKIKSSAKITATDLMEFGNRGVDAASLIGQAMGKTGAQIRADITAGTLDADAALDALAKGMSQKFDGAAANVKNTFEGATDRVRAAWRDVSADLLKPFVNPNGGGMLVDLMNSIADTIRAFQKLPEPVKLATGAAGSAIAAFALVGGTAITAAAKIRDFRDKMELLKGSMGKISLTAGLVGAAVGALVFIIAAVAQAQAEARARAEAYADALAQGADAAKRFIAEQLAMKDSFLWMDRGSAVENAKKLGISIDEVTKAVTGSAAEFEAFKARVEDAGRGNLDAQTAVGQLTEKVEQLRAAQSDAADTTRDTADAQKSLAGTTGKATDAAGNAADAYMQTADEAKKLADKVMGLVDAMNRANGIGQDAVTTNIHYRDSLAKIDEAIANAAAGVDGYSATLDLSTEAGRNNMGMLVDLAKDAQDAAEAQFALDGNTDSYRATLEASRQALIDRAELLGANSDEAQALAEQILHIPSDTEWELIAKTAKATEAIDSVLRLIDRNAYRTITLNVQTNESEVRFAGGNVALTRARGGPVFGPGGPTDDKVPAMLSNGEHVLTAAEVAAAGGHARVQQWRDSLTDARTPEGSEPELILTRTKGNR